MGQPEGQLTVRALLDPGALPPRAPTARVGVCGPRRRRASTATQCAHGEVTPLVMVDGGGKRGTARSCTPATSAACAYGSRGASATAVREPPGRRRSSDLASL